MVDLIPWLCPHFYSYSQLKAVLRKAARRETASHFSTVHSQLGGELACKVSHLGTREGADETKNSYDFQVPFLRIPVVCHRRITMKANY